MPTSANLDTVDLD